MMNQITAMYPFSHISISRFRHELHGRDPRPPVARHADRFVPVFGGVDTRTA
ncbi:hypothetical protein FHR81_003156 [Actinoalloteichus hoggarensis]|uniref:Uncharacterized protein n=1 Tax=Actinoalloteichus hoggarensis TaxID=1470176 RepID=A0A221W6M4_9PSEU|nr:hypothetical protein AHOG_19465 [Actinoalloteichus hoggarensis]MBB5922104.1 hypothetical protein [Actinoalloteichus hoggarensis]